MNSSNNNDKHLYRRKWIINVFHNKFTAWIVLTISLLLTVTAYFISKSIIKDKINNEFEFRANEIEAAIKDRMKTYEQVLWSGVGLFHSQPEAIVPLKEFKRFVETININTHWPGIQGIGFSIPIPANQLKQHENKMQAEGFKGFQVRPIEKRDEYSSIIYLEPFNWRNQRAHGYDMWSNEMRRAAMRRARDTGKAATSGIITLVQETSKDIQKGFLTYVPVYSTNNIPETEKERVNNFVGWIYSPFRAEDLMKGILGSEDKKIDFNIFDGLEPNIDTLLYTSLPNSILNNKNKNNIEQFKRVNLELQGRPWTIDFFIKKNTATDGDFLPQFIVFCGIVIDLLLFYVLLSLHFINLKTEKIVKLRTDELNKINNSLESKVEDRTKELAKSKESLEFEVKRRTESLNEKVKELEIFYKATIGREERIIELKKEINSLSKKFGYPEKYEV